MEYRVRVEKTYYYVVDAINQKTAKKMIAENKVDEFRKPTEKVFIQENVKNIKFHNPERDSEYDEKTIKRLIEIYRGMVRRCYNVLHQHWDLYGKNHIGICDEWRKDFYKFVDWSLTNGYSHELTLDKIENNKSYSPNNCRWATAQEQANNRKDTGHVTYNGRTYTRREIADMFNVDMKQLSIMLSKGVPLEQAIYKQQHSKPRGKYKTKK